MGLFSRSNSTATRRRGILQSASSSRGTSPGPDQPRSSRTSHDEDGRKFYQKGWLGSRTNSGASTPRLLPSRSGSRQDILITPIPEDVATDCSTADDRVPSAAASRDDAPSRQLLKRGRTPSKLSLSSALSDSTVQSSGSGNGRRKSLSRNGSSAPSPTSISSPTGFRHMTHVQHDQYAKMSQANDEGELVANFSALRASRSLRRDFRGIKTMEIHSRNSSIETTTASITPSEGGSSQFSAGTASSSSTRNSTLSLEPATVRAKPAVARAKISMESFSRPFLNGLPPTRAGPVVQPPTRKSSKRAAVRFDLADIPRSRGHERAGAPFDSVDLQRKVSPLWYSQIPPRLSLDDDMSEDDEDYVTPGEELWQTGEWLLQGYGRTLDTVSEENRAPSLETRRSTRDRHRQHDARDTTARQMPSSESNSSASASSSEESCATVTVASYSQASKQKAAYVSVQPPSSMTRYQTKTDRRISMKRSSISNGLFTGWAIEDWEEERRLSPKPQSLDGVLAESNQRQQQQQQQRRSPSSPKITRFGETHSITIPARRSPPTNEKPFVGRGSKDRTTGSSRAQHVPSGILKSSQRLDPSGAQTEKAPPVRSSQSSTSSSSSSRHERNASAPLLSTFATPRQGHARQQSTRV